MSYLEPALPLLLAIGVYGLIRAWRRSVKGKRPVLLTVSIVGTIALSMNFFAWLAARPLEVWYDGETAFPHEPAEAIVVLSGSTHFPSTNRPYIFAGADTYGRVEHAMWLFRHWKRLPILVCGGTTEREAPRSEVMRHVLETEGGVPADMIWTEKRSRSTHENALYGAEILREHGISRIALIVEASSMPRAAASFRKFGMTVVPAPIRFTELDGSLMDVFPSWHAIASNGETLHEVLGLLWYRVRGWI